MKKGKFSVKMKVIIAIVVAVIVFSTFMLFFGNRSEKVSVTGQNEIKTIDVPGKSVDLIVEGKSHKIKVTAETDVSSIQFKGENNVVNLCNGTIRKDVSVKDEGINNLIFSMNCP